MAQPVGIVAVRIAEGTLLQPLPHLLSAPRLDLGGVALVREEGG